MRTFLDGEKSDRAFSKLINLLRADQCVVLVGAGLSIEAGYRTWDEGIFGGSDGEPEQRVGLVQLARLSEAEIGQCEGDLSAIAEKCKQNLTPLQFIEFIRQEFGPAGASLRYTVAHSTIWNTNFQQLLTTNFDPCLYNSSNKEVCKDIQSYPALSLNPDRRCLYHIHGRAFLTEDEVGQDDTQFINWIIYTGQQYHDAYVNKLEISSFLYSIVRRYRILFLAFSMDDREFKWTLQYVNEQRLNLERMIAQGANKEDFSPEPNYIFLESPSADSFAAPNEYKRAYERTDETEYGLEKSGFRVIRFFRRNENFRGLVQALQELQNAAPYLALPVARRSPFKLYTDNDASITG